MKCYVCNLTIGIIFCVVALAVVAISFATDQWINCTVSSNATGQNGPLYNCTYCPEMFYSRSRGLFRTCFPNSNPSWINDYPYLRNSLVDSACLAERGYAVSPGDPNSQTPYYRNWAIDYQKRIDMMRSHWALFLVAITLLLVSSFLGMLGCWKLKLNVIVATTVLLLIATAAIAIGMGLFHGYYYLEQHKIIQAPFLGFILQTSEYSALRDATFCGFGFSYVLGWVGLITSFIAFICFLPAVFKLCKRWRKPKDKVKKKIQQPPVVAAPSLRKPTDWPVTQQNPTFSFFDDLIHTRNSTGLKVYPIAFDPYDLHLPTGIPAGSLRIPRYNQQIPGQFDVPMLHTKLPVNY